MTVLAFAWPGLSRADEPLDGRELVKTYRDIIGHYRRHDPAHSAEGYAAVVEIARWDLNRVRLAAALAPMPPPDVTTLVRLDGTKGNVTSSGNGTSTGNPNWARRVAAEKARAPLGNPNIDSTQAAILDARSRLAAEDKAADASGATSSPGAGEQEEVRRSATVAPMTPSAGSAPPPTTGVRGVCLIESFAEECANVLKAAALLHTDVATLELAQGQHARAATHRAIAGWLLWHLPRKAETAEDDDFVRDWLLAVNVGLRGTGSLSSARQLGQLGLGRFPRDEALLLSTATAIEAHTTLCYEADGTPLGGDDCFEIPIAFDAPLPERPLLRNARPLDRGSVLRDAESALRMLATQRPEDPEVHLRLGHVLLQRGQAKEAQLELRLVIDNATDTGHLAIARLLLGRLAETGQDANGALEHARAAQGAVPSSQSARMALASALLAHGDRAAAVAVMAALPNGPPGARDPWIEYLLGSTARYAPARAALYARVSLPLP